MVLLIILLKKATVLAARQGAVQQQLRAVLYRWQAAVMVAARYVFHLLGAVRLG